jgi:hypothetical protein
VVRHIALNLFKPHPTTLSFKRKRFPAALHRSQLSHDAARIIFNEPSSHPLEATIRQSAGKGDKLGKSYIPFSRSFLAFPGGTTAMSENFDKLKAKLAETGTLTDEEIQSANLTEDEKIWLNAERYARQRDKQEVITLDQYVAANKVLDTAAEGSPEYVEAQRIVDAYEKQA